MREKLKQHCTVISGFAFKSADLQTEGAVPVVKIGNISNGRNVIIDSDTQYVSSEFLSLDKKYHICKGDILISLTGSHMNQPNSVVGRVCRSYEECVYLLNQRAGKVICHTGTDPDYVYYLLSTKAMKESIVNRAYGAANQVNVSPTDIMNIKWPFHCHEEQKRISSILSAYDKLIEVNNKRIKVLEQMAENLYKEWFVRFRFPGCNNYIDADGLPKGWEKKRIKDFCTFLNGFAFKSEDYCEEGKYIVVTIKNVQDGYFDLSSIERINKLPERMVKYCRLEKGDVLMSLTGNVGRICTVSEEKCLLNQRVCKLQSKYPYFTYSFFKQEAIYQTLCNIAYGTAQLNLSPILVGKTKVVLPPESLQRRYNDWVRPLFMQKQKYIEENNVLIHQRDILLPRLMSRNLEV